MYFEHIQTGEKIIKLITVKNLATMKNQIVFCPSDSDESIFTLTEDLFFRDYRLLNMAA